MTCNFCDLEAVAIVNGHTPVCDGHASMIAVNLLQDGEHVGLSAQGILQHVVVPLERPDLNMTRYMADDQGFTFSQN